MNMLHIETTQDTRGLKKPELLDLADPTGVFASATAVAVCHGPAKTPMTEEVGTR
ncbi:hypothetical protein [Desulfovibrio sp. X2]|uniref:hypothetical protein n=1 Tax=Desulfovibrio sp. X2 TaxID=941449 RepID=UPI00155AE99F|nr:hypothetical protein [Desulfovibrio sp. X2]